MIKKFLKISSPQKFISNTHLRPPYIKYFLKKKILAIDTLVDTIFSISGGLFKI